MKSTSKGKSKEEEPGTLVELWERALGKYPEIVLKYGEFSGELLQAMLGIEARLSRSHYSESRHPAEKEEPRN
jgi:hypothetical protein